MAVGENVTEAENARDQIAAFSVHVSRRRPELWGDWMGVPAPRLADQLAMLSDLLAVLAPTGDSCDETPGFAPR
jgi:hypothetical protein